MADRQDPPPLAEGERAGPTRDVASMRIIVPCPTCGARVGATGAQLNQLVTGPCGHTFVWRAASLRNRITSPPVVIAPAAREQPARRLLPALAVGLLVGAGAVVAHPDTRSSSVFPAVMLACCLAGAALLVVARLRTRPNNSRTSDPPVRWTQTPEGRRYAAYNEAIAVARAAFAEVEAALRAARIEAAKSARAETAAKVATAPSADAVGPPKAPARPSQTPEKPGADSATADPARIGTMAYERQLAAVESPRAGTRVLWTRSEWLGSSEAEFQRRVVDLFTAQGYTATETEGTLISLKRDGQRHILQCLLPTDRTVSPADVERVFASLTGASATRGAAAWLLVTRAQFDTAAIEFAIDKRIRLLTVDDLLEMSAQEPTRDLLGDPATTMMEARIAMSTGEASPQVEAAASAEKPGAVAAGAAPAGRRTVDYQRQQAVTGSSQAGTQVLWSRGEWTAASAAEFQRRVVALFMAQGYKVDVSPAGRAEGALFTLEKDGHRQVVQCLVPVNGVVSSLEVERFLGTLGAKLAPGRPEAGLLVTSGHFDAEAIEFVTGQPLRLIDIEQLLEMSTAEASRDLLGDTTTTITGTKIETSGAASPRDPITSMMGVGAASVGDSTRAFELLEAGTSAAQMTSTVQGSTGRVLAVGGVLFPPEGKGDDARVGFFRRLGSLCLLIGRDPYPVPLGALRDYLLARDLISPRANVLRLLAPPIRGLNSGAAVQVWLDSSTEAEEARLEASKALEASATLDAYIAKLRAHLAGRASRAG